MSCLYEALLHEQEELLTIINLVTQYTKNVPEGYLRISHSKKAVQYYHKSVENNEICKAGKYIRKNDKKLAYDLAQRDYDLKLLETAKRELDAIQTLIKTYNPNALQHVYEEINSYRKKIVSPRVVSDEAYVKEWCGKKYVGKFFEQGMAEIYTNKNERVQSKSEKIIADMLYKFGVPYRYEYPIILNGVNTMYPDFTVLNVKTRSEMYWEHMGMMDNSEYCQKALYKLDTYTKNGMLPGDKLIVTHETSKRPLETATIEKVIQKYLIHS